MSLMQINEIFNFEKGVLQSSKSIPGDYDFITASSDWKTHHDFTHECEALIFAAAASGSLGRTHYVKGKFISSDLCFIITPKDPVNLPVDLKFYHILFNELKDEIVRNTKAGTSKEAIGLGSFGKHKLPYFDIKQQIEIKQRFVNLEETNEAISTELTHQLTLVKKLRQQLLQDAVQGKLVPQNPSDEPASELLKKIKAEKQQLIAQGKLKKEKELPPIKAEEIPFEIPEGWVWCRLGEVTIDISYGTSEKADSTGEIPVLRMGNITTNGEILYSNLKYVSSSISDLPKLYLQNGDLVFNRTNSYELVGKSGVFENEEPYTLASYLIRVRFISSIQSKYIANYINSKVCRETQLEPQIIQQNGQANFNGTKLSNIIIPLPTASEQHRIVQKLDELMQTCDALETSIKASAEQNEKLLQQVLREALRKEAVMRTH
jgi:type I restriction enzyme, S subunit